MRLTEQQGLTRQGTERVLLQATEGPWRCEAEECSGRSRQGSKTMGQRGEGGDERGQAGGRAGTARRARALPGNAGSRMQVSVARSR